MLHYMFVNQLQYFRDVSKDTSNSGRRMRTPLSARMNLKHQRQGPNMSESQLGFSASDV